MDGMMDGWVDGWRDTVYGRETDTWQMLAVWSAEKNGLMSVILVDRVLRGSSTVVQMQFGP